MMWWELKNSWVPLTSFLSTRLTNWPVTPSFIAEASRTLFNRKYTPSLMTLHSSRATRKKTTAQNTSAQLSFSFLNIFLLWMYNFRPQDDTAERRLKILDAFYFVCESESARVCAVAWSVERRAQNDQISIDTFFGEPIISSDMIFRPLTKLQVRRDEKLKQKSSSLQCIMTRRFEYRWPRSSSRAKWNSYSK